MQPLVEVTKDDWEQWRQSEVTRKFFGMIAERREEAIQYLAFGNTGSFSKQNITVGAINAYTHILGTRFEEDQNDGTS